VIIIISRPSISQLGSKRQVVDTHKYVIIMIHYNSFTPVQVAACSKAWVYGRSLARIVGSISVGGMDVILC